MRTDLIKHAKERIKRDDYRCPLAEAVTADKVLDELAPSDPAGCPRTAIRCPQGQFVLKVVK